MLAAVMEWAAAEVDKERRLPRLLAVSADAEERSLCR